jgi:hypothetical protein
MSKPVRSTVFERTQLIEHPQPYNYQVTRLVTDEGTRLTGSVSNSTALRVTLRDVEGVQRAVYQDLPPRKRDEETAHPDTLPAQIYDDNMGTLFKALCRATTLSFLVKDINARRWSFDRHPFQLMMQILTPAWIEYQALGDQSSPGSANIVRMAAKTIAAWNKAEFPADTTMDAKIYQFFYYCILADHNMCGSLPFNPALVGPVMAATLSTERTATFTMLEERYSITLPHFGSRYPLRDSAVIPGTFSSQSLKSEEEQPVMPEVTFD